MPLLEVFAYFDRDTYAVVLSISRQRSTNLCDNLHIQYRRSALPAKNTQIIDMRHVLEFRKAISRYLAWSRRHD